MTALLQNSLHHNCTRIPQKPINTYILFTVSSPFFLTSHHSLSLTQYKFMAKNYKSTLFKSIRWVWRKKPSKDLYRWGVICLGEGGKFCHAMPSHDCTMSSNTGDTGTSSLWGVHLEGCLQDTTTPQHTIPPLMAYVALKAFSELRWLLAEDHRMKGVASLEQPCICFSCVYFTNTISNILAIKCTCYAFQLMCTVTNN